MQDRQIKWRIGWYNEIKIPMLTAGVIFDNGSESLQERIDAMNKLVTTTILPALPDDPKGFTAEEEFMQIALRNRVVHARCKVIIMQVLQQIKTPER
jgi:hypothetical protein